MDSLPQERWRTGRRQYWSPDKKEKRWYPKDEQPPGCVWVGHKPKRIKLKDFTDLEWKEYIYERCLIHPVTGCWIWQHALLKPSKANPAGGGYGMMAFYEGSKYKMRLVHTVAYQLWVGPIPADRDICHHDRLCPSKACCNPDHLYAGTPQQNTNDAVIKGTWKPGGFTKGKHIYTDGVRREYHVPGTEPAGWILTKYATVRKYTYVMDDARATFIEGTQPEGWVRAYNGRGGTKDSKWYTNGLKNQLWFPGLPLPSADEGWRPGQTADHSKNKENK